MTAKQLVLQWVEAFNSGDADAISNFYAEDAVNHQVANEPVVTGISYLFSECTVYLYRSNKVETTNLQ